MDVADMISDLGDHGFADTESDTKLRVLQDAIWEIEGLRPWPFLDARVNLTYSGSSPAASNDPGNIRTVLKLKDATSGANLEPTTAVDLEEFVGTQIGQVGTPSMYYFEGDALRVWPVPSAGTTLRLRYVRSSDEISESTLEAAVLIPKRHHRVIVLGALIRLYDMEDDVELGERFQAHYEARIERMVDDLFRKQLDRPDYIRVNDPDLWDYDW